MVQEHKRISGLTGNEIFFLERMGYRPGQLCVGNSVVALGILKGIGAGLSTLGGGEIEEVTQLVHDGRTHAFDRMMEEAAHYGGVGLTGVSFDLINHGGNIEFITVGSTIHQKDGNESIRFSTSADVAKLYCQVDAGFSPIKFVFGNVAYSIGLGGSILGGLKSLARGEVREYTEIFDRTRHLALTRITDEAKRCKANAVVGIETTISPLLGAQEMIMVGTASHHPAIDAFDQKPVTSDMTN
ncbi:MAG: heavy metal-binding domain-containing protein, partial [Betaproteobacteria bacterium]|nr:heavy metal-binding domain-containing protein [Betaproteobacteria bacterium]